MKVTESETRTFKKIKDADIKMKKRFFTFSVLTLSLLMLSIIPTFVFAATAAGCCSFSGWGLSYSECRSKSFPDEASCRAYLAGGNGICAEYSGGFAGTFTLTQDCTGGGGGEEDNEISPEERQRIEKEREEKLREQAREEAEKKYEEQRKEIEKEVQEESEALKKERERQETIRQEKAADTFEPLFGRKTGEGISQNGYPHASYLAEDPGNFQLTFADSGQVKLINIETGQQANFGGIGVHVGEEIPLPPINPSGLSKKSISGGKQSGTPPDYKAELKGAEDWLEANPKSLKDPKTGEALLGFEIKVKENAPLNLADVNLEIEEDGQKIGEIPLKFDIEEGTVIFGPGISNYQLAEELKGCYKKPDDACCSIFEVYDRVQACQDLKAQPLEEGIPSECLDFLEKTTEEEQILHPENVPPKCKEFAASAMPEENTTLENNDTFYDEHGKKLGFFKIIFIKTILGFHKWFG